MLALYGAIASYNAVVCVLAETPVADFDFRYESRGGANTAPLVAGPDRAIIGVAGTEHRHSLRRRRTCRMQIASRTELMKTATAAAAARGYSSTTDR